MKRAKAQGSDATRDALAKLLVLDMPLSSLRRALELLAAHERAMQAEALEEAAGHAERVIAPSLIGYAFGKTLRDLAAERRKG